MAHSNERKIQLAERIARWKREAEDIERAKNVVEVWNRFLAQNVPPMFYPTIEGAILAGHPWLIVHCQSCNLMIDLDLRIKPRPAGATVVMAFRDIRCPRCNGHGRPKILRLAQGHSPSS